MKRTIAIISFCSALLLGACGGAGGGTTAGAPGGTTTNVSGNGVKGPFHLGATVVATKLNTDGTPTATTATTTVSDNLGTYSLTGITWTGPTEVAITGTYLDERTGNILGPDTAKALIVIPALGAAVNSATVNPNVASTVAAEVAKTQLAAATATGAAVDPASVVAAASQTALQALGLPTTDAYGNPVDPAKLNPLQTADPVNAAANQQLLVLSAALVDAYANSGAASVQALAASLATDVATGAPLGSSSGATTAINNGIANANANAATIAANVSSAMAAAGATPPANLNATTLQSAATVAQKQVATTLKGYAIAGNSFTVGAATYTVDPYGVASTAGTTPYSNVVLGFTFNDYSGVTTPRTQSVALNFDIYSLNDSRRISGSLSQVDVYTDGVGNVSVTVPANAVLTYSGIDAQGVTVSGTATNIAANVIQTLNNVVSIDANALLNTIQRKVQAVNPNNVQLNVLNTAGTFAFEFGMGLNVGHENAAGNGIDRLFPLTAVGGRGIRGTITTQ